MWLYYLRGIAFKSCLILLCFTVLLHRVVAAVPPDEPDPNRSPGVVYYQTDKDPPLTGPLSRFYANVLDTVTFLIGYNPPNGYATTLGYGDAPDIVYGHSSCYNMSDQPKCRQCVKNAFDDIQKVNNYAVGGVIWINNATDRCRLRYEAYNFTNEVIALGALGVIGPNVSTPASPPQTAYLSPLGSKSSNTRAIAGIVGGTVGAGLVCVIIGIIVWRLRKKYTKLDERGDALDGVEGTMVFKYQELSQATSSFSDANKLGQGGFGSVYKACLADGTVMAVKKLSLQSNQGRTEFVNEINVITSIKHRNLVKLKGYCIEEERLLVYEFLENGSLDQALFGAEAKPWLTWQSRLEIVFGVARGLAYLHEESPVQIIHRDIKASNILLDKQLQPKISDFGVSKLVDLEKGFTSTNIAGTFGYMAPEYVTRGKLSSKADVFGYGILVLEIVTGRRCVDSTLPTDTVILVHHVWKFHQAGRVEECVDKRLGTDFINEDLVRLIRIAMLCTQDDENDRPTMGTVVAMLRGYVEIPDVSYELPGYLANDNTLNSVINSTNIMTQPTAR